MAVSLAGFSIFIHIVPIAQLPAPSNPGHSELGALLGTASSKSFFHGQAAKAKSKPAELALILACTKGAAAGKR